MMQYDLYDNQIHNFNARGHFASEFRTEAIRASDPAFYDFSWAKKNVVFAVHCDDCIILLTIRPDNKEFIHEEQPRSN